MIITINGVYFEVGEHCEITIEGEARVTVNQRAQLNVKQRQDEVERISLQTYIESCLQSGSMDPWSYEPSNKRSSSVTPK